ncbi:unnamed protein product [Vicia faba]|uniref:aspartyl aminopeptidase n=1 Tax=Vicia faba TaxID=3906 RepID=A0AAV1A584_VICFA|nr:unnamed protein product [Vicia faba]
MATITRPHILLHSRAPSLNLKLNSSSSFLRHQKLPNSLPFTRRRSFCSANSTSHKSESVSIVNDLLDYLNESWTHFHATAEAKRQLLAAGFHLLNENEEWNLKPGGRYFFTRNMSCLVAFAVGEKYDVGNGFYAIAAHTDSPCLKLKPKTASLKSSYMMGESFLEEVIVLFFISLSKSTDPFCGFPLWPFILTAQ